jgi:hypothetical protein
MVISKIVVIAMGLVAIMPHSDEDKGASILLRDALLTTPHAELTDGTRCPVHPHMPLVQQTVGHCLGDCSFLTLPATGVEAVSARILGLSGATASPEKLRWLPFSQALSFDNLRGTAAAEDSDYWFRYGNSAGNAKVSGECRGDDLSCPIVARFDVGIGGVKACSLSQYRDPRRTGIAGFVVKRFEDVAPEDVLPAEGLPLAESYAIELGSDMPAPLRLTAEHFGAGRLTRRTAALYPDEAGTIVLVVSNLPLSNSHHRGADSCKRVHDSATAHSAVVYDLAAGQWAAKDRHVPHLARKVVGTPRQPECANHLAELAAHIPGPLEYPSNPAKCKPPGVMAEP